MRYAIRFAPGTTAHMRALTARQRANVYDAIEKALVHEPLAQSRHRKRLRENEVARWELRVEDLRVFYDVDTQAGVVRVLALGRKEGNHLWIAGRKVRL